MPSRLTAPSVPGGTGRSEVMRKVRRPVGLAHLGRAGVGGGGRHRGRVGEGEQVPQARRGHPCEHGQEGRDAAVGPRVPPAAGPALLLRDPARGLRAVAELRGRGAEDEERDHEREAGQAESRGDRRPDDDRRDGARDVDRPREEGGHGDRRVHREPDEGAPREAAGRRGGARAPRRRRGAGRGPPRGAPSRCRRGSWGATRRGRRRGRGRGRRRSCAASAGRRGRGRPARPRPRGNAAAAVPQATNAAKPTQPLRAFQGRRGPPAAWPTSEAMPSPTARMPQPAAAIHRRSRNSRMRPSTASG